MEDALNAMQQSMALLEQELVAQRTTNLLATSSYEVLLVTICSCGSSCLCL